MSHQYTLEVCLDSADSVLQAQEAGAHRVELCDNLFGGGTTPSFGTIKAARRIASDILVHVIIRPRPGDFCYTDLEFEAMREDIIACREIGIDGVVIGILKKDGSVDKERCAALVQAAGEMNVTFHRAFDVSDNPFQALEDIITVGCNRILTSGQECTVIEGAPLIQQLIEKAGNRLTIMPGGDITERNLTRIVQATGAQEFHMNLDHVVESTMNHRAEHIPMGGLLRMPEFLNAYTSPHRVKTILSGLNPS
ncbi:MAG: copper homeostasis protein CutC [Spirochaetales bacterium]|nr:copper homeostasis protein CutC [Spirochaetales bacterium]